jgi:hypothetical protein
MKIMGTSVPEDVSMTVRTYLPHIIEISVPVHQLAQATPQKTLNLFNNATRTSVLTLKPVSQHEKCYPG